MADKAGWSTKVANLLLYLLIAFLLLRPDGPILTYVARAQEAREIRGKIERNWKTLTALAHPISRKRPPQLIAVSDYQCPYCRRMHPILEKFTQLYPDIGIGYLHYPLPNHSAAEPAARAMICASRGTNPDSLHNALMESDNWTGSQDSLLALAAGLNLDVEALARCMASDATRAALSAHVQLAQELGVSGTPSFISRRRLVAGVQGLADLERLAATP